MKSRKSIFCVALAALMLFAFTACENNAPTSPLFGKSVESITPVEYPDIVYYNDSMISEAVDTADVLLDVVFDDGSKEQYTGLELGLTNDAASTVKGVAEVYTAKYGQANAIKVVIPAYTAEITAIDVSGAKFTEIEADEQYSPKALQDGEGIKVVYAYNGTESITKDFDEQTDIDYDFTGRDDFDMPVNVSSKLDLEAGNEYAFNSKNFEAKNEGVEVIGTWTIKVVEPKEPAVTDFDVVVSDATTEYFVGQQLSSVAYKATFMYDDKETTVNSSDSSTWKLSFENYKGDYRFEEAKTYSNIIVLLKDSTGEVVAQDTLSVTVKADYPKTFTVTPVDNIDTKVEEKDWKVGDSIPSSFYTFKVASYASGLDYEDLADLGFEAPTVNTASANFKALTTLKKGFTSDTIIPSFEFTGSPAGTQTVKTCSPASGVTITIAE